MDSSYKIIYIFQQQRPLNVLVPEAADPGHEQADDVRGQSRAQ